MIAPLQYLSGAGAKAAPVVALTWGVLVISIAVIIIIAGLLAAAVWRKRPVSAMADVLPDMGGLNWLWIGVSTSALALLVTVVWTVKVLADIEAPPTPPAVTITITGKQWWWQAHYEGAAGPFDTANEIHIPVGEPVRLKLIGGDVIHSFWVPALAGKIDAIPGQVNETWLQAAQSGIYMGQCTEYCGVQHAKMLLRLVAEPRPQFQAWWAHQLAPAPDAPDFNAHCGNCHAVRGTDAKGSYGPDLSHLMQRRALASGVLPNDDAMRARWIADPQGLKPGNQMPQVGLTDAERANIQNYLRVLN
jgi:cytochrome c oxidase subunit 2